MFFNLMLPTSVGGDVVRAWYLDGGARRRTAAFASVLLDRLNGLVVLVALACLAATFSPRALPEWITWSAWGMAAGGALAFFILEYLAWHAAKSPARIVGEVPSKREFFWAKLRLVLSIMRLPRILLPTLLLSFFVQAANVLLVWLLGQGLGITVPWNFYCVMVPMVSLLTLLPISVNGMGVREQATIQFLALLGVAEGTALTLSMLWFAVNAALSLAGGAVYMLGHFPKPEAQTREVTRGSVDSDSDQGRTGQHRKAA